MSRLRPLLLLLALLALRGLAAEPVLKIIGPEKSLAFTAAAFAALPHVPLTAPDPYTQVPRHFSGVAVRELLSRVGLPFGDKLRGPAQQLAVLVRASDGYGVVFALAEFDEAFSDRTLLLADQEDDKPLYEKAAPFQLVVPGDKKGARWVRMVRAIEIVSVGAIMPRPADQPSSSRRVFPSFSPTRGSSRFLGDGDPQAPVALPTGDIDSVVAKAQSDPPSPDHFPHSP